jgi:RHS repeat-associated protein
VSADILDLTYSYVDTSGHNNGNVASINNNIIGSASQKFTYDSLNRIATAQTSGTAGNGLASCWAETYTYDAWGNLYAFGANPTTQSAYTGCSQESGLSSSPTTKNQLSAYGYDSAGNVINIPAVATYTYDAENHLLSTAGVNYSYDGDGKRVMKSTGKIYWYGAGGAPVIETDATGNFQYRYFYFDGMRVARDEANDWVDHYINDALGNARIVYGNNGGWDQSEYYPFGGERVVDGRTLAGNHFKFTGKERDSESGLDDSVVRYYSSAMGRFTRPDPAQWAGFEHKDDPQAWNGYAYGRNNPLLYTDPDGTTYRICDHSDNSEQNCTLVSDEQFSQLQKDPGAGISLRNGDIYANGAKQGTYYQTDVDLPPGVADMLHQAGVMGQTGLNYAMLATAPNYALMAITPLLVGGGTTTLTLGIAASPLLPVVPSAIEKLQQIGVSVQEATAIVESPTTQKVIDNLNSGNINHYAEAGGKLVRITTNPEGTRIISAGFARANQITNGIANGRFVPK